jgi:hypothetical protein
LKIIPDMALATSRNYKMVPATSFHHIFATTTPISVILVSKFSESFTLSFHAFIIHVCCILIDFFVYFTLGNVVPEPFFEDFQDQAFEESLLFFVDQQGKLP